MITEQDVSKANADKLRKKPSMVLVKQTEPFLYSRVGTCVHTPGKGWKFLSAVAGHQGSRKFWNDCNRCIPEWAFDLADEMLTATEWQAMLNGERPNLMR